MSFQGILVEQDSPAIHVSYHDGEHYNSVRRADDHTSGPPLPIAIAERLPTSAEKAAARSWGPAQEELVMRGTGCYDDPAAVQQALEAAHGNPDQVRAVVLDNGRRYRTARVIGGFFLLALFQSNWDMVHGPEQKELWGSPIFLNK